MYDGMDEFDGREVVISFIDKDATCNIEAYGCLFELEWLENAMEERNGDNA